MRSLLSRLEALERRVASAGCLCSDGIAPAPLIVFTRRDYLATADAGLHCSPVHSRPARMPAVIFVSRHA